MWWLNTQQTYLQHDLLHLLVRRLELPDEDQHHLSCVVVGILGVHQWDQITDSFEERSQTLETTDQEFKLTQRFWTRLGETLASRGSLCRHVQAQTSPFLCAA